MDRPRSQERGKSSKFRHSDESMDRRPSDAFVFPTHDEKRPIRRLQSPPRRKVWLPRYYNPGFRGRFHKPRDEHSFRKPGFAMQKHHRFSPGVAFHHSGHFPPKIRHTALREREGEWDMERESSNASSHPKQDTASRRFSSSRSSSSRDKDKQFPVSQSERNESRERDHKRSSSKERAQSRDSELPSSAAQEAARNRAIEEKRKEIEKVYYQESGTFHLVVKMLIEKDPTLERLVCASLQENLRDIGARCAEAMETFIKEYDSEALCH
ncbi:uncharacterized protein LOC143013390 [Genypterus blacodes]|uniref:uncharacterized protein LOC143013390 n=1 Tax=Genypterus blacodes TaxID=154954 RepID=UPI003F75CEEB